MNLKLLSLLFLFLLSCGNSDGATEAKDCVVTNCHGKEVTCGFGEALMCTEQYVIGDLCRQYVECKVQDGVCAPKELDKYQQCVACIKTCESKDAIEAFQCDEGCRNQLAIKTLK
jgi:hypothetical protein